MDVTIRDETLSVVLEVSPLSLNPPALTYQRDSGSLDTRANQGELGDQIEADPAAFLCSVLQQADPSGDIVLFAVFHEPTQGVALDRSTALDKGLIAVAHLFADREAQATNEIVLAHELLHTLRATDKYSLTTNAPSYPDGYAAPDARPLLPQTKAELMAGRIALDERRAEMPRDLGEVVIGAATAREIGWQSRR